jgi:hypothetical protein
MDPDKQIRYASFYGRIEVVKKLLKDPRVDPSNCDNYAIKWASRNGHIEVVNILLEDPRVDPSDTNNYALRWSAHELKYPKENPKMECIIDRLLLDLRVYNDAQVKIRFRHRLEELEKLKITINKIMNIPEDIFYEIGCYVSYKEYYKLLKNFKKISSNV